MSYISRESQRQLGQVVDAQAVCDQSEQALSHLQR